MKKFIKWFADELSYDDNCRLYKLNAVRISEENIEIFINYTFPKNLGYYTTTVSGYLGQYYNIKTR